MSDTVNMTEYFEKFDNFYEINGNLTSETHFLYTVECAIPPNWLASDYPRYPRFSTDGGKTWEHSGEGA